MFKMDITKDLDKCDKDFLVDICERIDVYPMLNKCTMLDIVRIHASGLLNEFDYPKLSLHIDQVRKEFLKDILKTLKKRKRYVR